MRRIRLILLFGALFVGLQTVKAQDLDALGGFTPYSVFGIGDLSYSSSASNLGMGGIGVGVRDNRFVNFLNVASLTQRDTLSFMLDFGLSGKNVYLRDKNTNSAFNTVNINNFVFSAPIKDKMAFMFGISPYSNMGYKFQSSEQNKSIIVEYGDIKYRKYGNGSLNQIFLGAAARVHKDVSVGLQGIYYFGTLTNHSDIIFSTNPSLRTIESGWRYSPTGWAVEGAVQASHKFSEDYTLTLGATYRAKTRLKGSYDRFAMAYDVIKDTILNQKYSNSVNVPGKFAVGLSLRKGERWMAGIDYTRQDWSKANFIKTPGVNFTAQAANALRAGVEYTPNRYDIRYYYKKMTYRAGAYYDQTYVSLDGKSINRIGFTLGVSLPIYRLHNSLNLAVDFGQRGAKSGNLVKENYVNFIVSLNMHDLWFIKPRYE